MIHRTTRLTFTDILEAIEMTVNRDLFELYPQIRALRSGFTE